MEEIEESINIILIGETAVGCQQLSNITSSFVFLDGENCCTSWKFNTRTMFIKNKKYEINLYNGPGEKLFYGMNILFLKNSDVVIFVYDITRRHTFLELNNYINRAIEVLGDKFIGAIVGNKFDLYLYEQVTEKEVEELANKYGYKFKFVSAKCDPE